MTAAISHCNITESSAWCLTALDSARDNVFVEMATGPTRFAFFLRQQGSWQSSSQSLISFLPEAPFWKAPARQEGSGSRCWIRGPEVCTSLAFGAIRAAFWGLSGRSHATSILRAHDYSLCSRWRALNPCRSCLRKVS